MLSRLQWRQVICAEITWTKKFLYINLHLVAICSPPLIFHFSPSNSTFLCVAHTSTSLSSLFMCFLGPQSHSSCSVLQCPELCTCSNNIVDCRGKGLTEIPTNLPETITEMWVRSRHTHTHTYTSGLLSLWGLSIDVMVFIPCKHWPITGNILHFYILHGDLNLHGDLP